MTKLPRISSSDCIKVLLKLGFYIDHQKGSHIILYRDNPYAKVVVPENREMPSGTLRAIIKSADLTVDEFIELL